MRAYAKSGDTNTLVSDIKHSYEYDKTGNLTKKTEAGFDMSNLFFEITNGVHFVLGFDKYNKKSYEYIGNIDVFTANNILSGTYSDAKGQKYIFDNNGNAIFPDRKFKYRIGLDFAVETPNADYFYDVTFDEIYVYKFANNKLEIYRTQGEANDEIEAYPFLSLFISSEKSHE